MAKPPIKIGTEEDFFKRGRQLATAADRGELIREFAPIKIFFDLEFSDLESAAMLISAGFVTETNEVLYVEVEEAFWLPKASQFVLDEVKPQLSGQGLPAHEAAEKILGWLNARGPNVTLISDSDWDQKILRKHLHQTGYPWPDHWKWEKVPLNLPSRIHHAYDCAYQEWFLRSGRAQHHALNDAQAMRDAHVVAISGNE
jgi:hypothetical protein